MSVPAAIEPDTSAATSREKESTVITPDRNTPAGGGGGGWRWEAQLEGS